MLKQTLSINSRMKINTSAFIFKLLKLRLNLWYLYGYQIKKCQLYLITWARPWTALGSSQLFIIVIQIFTYHG